MGKKRRKKIIFIKTIKFFMYLFGLFFVLAFSAGIVVFSYFAKDLPNPEQILNQKVAESTKIYDRTGTVLLYDIYGEEKRTVVPLENMSAFLKNAIVATEDENFYQHKGMDFKAILRALFVDIVKKGKIQGGSTITQQLIKNSILTSEKTIIRKIKEAVLSFELERKYTKNEILELYLNQIPFGSNAYGAEAAAKTFFGKTAEKLSLNEAAVLAALPKAPSYYSPYGEHKESLIERKNMILNKMRTLNFISEEQLLEAKNEELEFLPQKIKIQAPHFVMFVREYLNSKYGERYLQKAGLRVYTTLNFQLQQKAEEMIKKWGDINEKKYGAQNAALVALDPQTGQILAMVGSRDYFDEKNDGNVNTALSLRQPGSAFKPFVYAEAFNKGYLPETIVFDLKTEFNPNCPATADQETDQYGLKCYHPNNYSKTFRGPINLRNSLAQSLNVPSVKVLYLAGIDDAIKLAEKMGITSLKNGGFGLSLVLGGAEVKLLELTSAYGVFANDGILNYNTPILKIINSNGKILEQHQTQPKTALKKQTSRLINDILSDNAARSPIFGEINNLYIEGYQTAAKTGTTQEYKDAWAIGYSPNIAVGVWSGNNIPQPMKRGADGANVSGPIWKEFMSAALKNYPRRDFIKPEPSMETKGVIVGKFEEETIIKIDAVSQKLATEFTPPEFIEEQVYKKAHTILKYIDRNNPLGEIPENPEKDPQFTNWEEPVLLWSNDPKRAAEGRYYQKEPPKEQDDIHTKENLPNITITKPKNNEKIKGNIIFIEATISGKYPIRQVDFFLNGQLIGSDTKLPYATSYIISSQEKNTKEQLIKIRVFDIKGNKNETENVITFQ